METNTTKKLTSEEIMERIEKLSKCSPNIHINLNRSRKKLRDMPVRIKSVYNNFFIVEHDDNGYIARYTIQYSELLTKEIEITEFTDTI